MSFDPNAQQIRALPTPSLVLDADALERNIERMNTFLEGHDAWARPHTKSHKSPQIATLQAAQSRTVGICCARVSEAEAMVRAGLDSVLLTSPIVTTEKLERWVALAGDRDGLWTVVDSELGLERLADVATERGARCGVVVDLDPGFHRTGVTMGPPAVELARKVEATPGLTFHGIQMYAGTLMHLDSATERRSRSATLWAEASTTVEAIRASGIECPVLTGGGTGTFDIDAEIGIATDLQVGSYVFMDAQYRVIDNPSSSKRSAPFDFFEPSLFVVAAAISQPDPELITVDAGFKSLSIDHRPEVAGPPDLRYDFAGDEHGMIRLGGSPGAIALGDRVALLVSHCDPTVNLHDRYVVLRDGVPVEEWPIAARGVP